MKKILIILFFVLANIISPLIIQAGIQPVRLRCEYRNNPLGIDITTPRLSWELISDSRNQQQKAYQIQVASSETLLEQNLADLWDTKRVESNQTIHIEYKGLPLTSRLQCYWRIRAWDQNNKPSNWSSAAMWSMGLLNSSDWKARWIGLHEKSVSADSSQPASYLRKEFRADKKIKKATVYVTGLGLYELHINGKRIGNHILAPEITTYNKRLFYDTYDVTEYLHKGNNTVGGILGDGWLRSPFFLTSPVSQRAFNGKQGLICQIEITFQDDSSQTIVSDGSWKGTLNGPIRTQSLYDGEIYDARLEQNGWDKTGFDQSQWKPVILQEFSGAKLVWQRNEPIQVTRKLEAISLNEPKPGVHVFDLGQNMAGWVRLKIRGSKGDQIILRHAEMLKKDGMVYTDNLRKATQVDQFIKGNDTEETFVPHFTYHGFRYVEVTGLKEPPKLKDITGEVFHSSSKIVGSFECSDPFLNKLMNNILWTQRANLMGLPTDCPQRDERCGWLGDIQTFSQISIFNMDMAGFLGKLTQDLRDSQNVSGAYPDFTPHPSIPFHPKQSFYGAPAWADAGVIIPWRMYQNYGDKRLLEEHFESAKKWVDFIHRNNPDYLWKNQRGHDYGDWLNGDTLIHKNWPKKGGALSREVLATAFFAHSTETVSKMAKVIGREKEAEFYANLFDKIRAAFQKKYVKTDGTILGNTQAGYALALNFNLFPDKLKKQAAVHMVQGIDRYNGHLSTGIQTTHRAMLELSRYGYHDKAYQLLMLRTFPSWGFMIENGATTIWERWDGYVKGRGFQNSGMNSFNHWALGAVGEWVWRNTIGINPDDNSPGFQHFTISPRPGGGLSWAKGNYQSIRGMISCQWKIEKGIITVQVTIPVNTNATVLIPTSNPSSVKLSEEQSKNVRLLNTKNQQATYSVVSGSYTFTAAAP